MPAWTHSMEVSLEWGGKDKGGMGNDINVNQIKLGPAGGLGLMGDIPKRIYPIQLQEAWKARQDFTECFLRRQQRVNDLTQYFAKWTINYYLLMALLVEIQFTKSLRWPFPSLPSFHSKWQLLKYVSFLLLKILILSQLPSLPSAFTSLSWSSLSGSFCVAHFTSSSCIPTQ